MKLRKQFNYPSKKEKILIAEGCDKLIAIAKEKSSKHYEEENNRQRENNGKCPNCRDSSIVNKIARVEGSGYVSGSFALGFGSVYGSSKTDTNEVNHCNKCGNQWKKYGISYKWYDDIIADWLNDLSTIREGKYTFADTTLSVLKDIPAESIWKELNRISDKCYYSTRENLSLSFLRTKFDSVYESKNLTQHLLITLVALSRLG